MSRSTFVILLKRTHCTSLKVIAWQESPSNQAQSKEDKHKMRANAGLLANTDFHHSALRERFSSVIFAYSYEFVAIAFHRCEQDRENILVLTCSVVLGRQRSRHATMTGET